MAIVTWKLVVEKGVVGQGMYVPVCLPLKIVVMDSGIESVEIKSEQTGKASFSWVKFPSSSRNRVPDSYKFRMAFFNSFLFKKILK